MAKPWDLQQRWQLRASTVLILYLPLVLGLSFLERAITGARFVTYLAGFMEIAAASMPFVLLFAWVFALAYLIASVVKRNPQVQFAVEFFVALALDLWVATTVY